MHGEVQGKKKRLGSQRLPGRPSCIAGTWRVLRQAALKGRGSRARAPVVGGDSECIVCSSCKSPGWLAQPRRECRQPPSRGAWRRARRGVDACAPRRSRRTGRSSTSPRWRRWGTACSSSRARTRRRLPGASSWRRRARTTLTCPRASWGR